MTETWAIERHAAAAWPAADARERDGWLLRHTPGVARRRSNSALPLRSQPSPEAAIEDIEAFYARRGLLTAIQVSPAAENADLDAFLAARGYRQAAPTRVCVATAETVLAATEHCAAPSVRLAEGPTAEWLEAFVALDHHDDSARVAARVVPRIPGPAAFLTAVDEGRVAGMGVFVAARGRSGVFCMATAPAYRRRGLATAILNTGARWVRDQGAVDLYLQVEEDNHAARLLYEGIGFRFSHGYHYRLR